MPSWSSTTNSWGSTWRISRSRGIDTALAASITRRTSSRSITRFLFETAMTPRELKPLMWVPAMPDVGGADLDPGHELGLLEHALDRVDRGLEVDDDALAQALRLGLADADHVEAALVGDLGDDRADLVGADVEPDDVAVLLLAPGPSSYSRCGGAAASAPALARRGDGRRAARARPDRGRGVSAASRTGRRPAAGSAGARPAWRARPGARRGCAGRPGSLRVDAAPEAQVEVLGVGRALHEVLAQAEERHEALAVRRVAEEEHLAGAAQHDPRSPAGST